MAQDQNTTWGTDTPISLPVPSKHRVLVDMGALGFSEFGIQHNLTTGDLAEYLPTFLPQRSQDG